MKYVVNLNFFCQADNLRDAIALAKDHAQVLPHEQEDRIKIIAIFDANGKTIQYGEDG